MPWRVKPSGEPVWIGKVLFAGCGSRLLVGLPGVETLALENFEQRHVFDQISKFLERRHELAPGKHLS
jgi:hypothetical protein